eukprot:TRINITY_DN37815_c0_g1_i1.p1 TRINITY_DN37815_c0_g1~~TRINITY_DN37815_c0_g1_i1.p1  ORF type:complete len:115 (-),score=17.72 TRINITY_DN37815_c0_g1_i1:255-599(-)
MEGVFVHGRMHEELKIGKVPLLDEEIILDASITTPCHAGAASYVFVFPRSRSVGGVVAAQDTVSKPLIQCRKVFKDRTAGNVDLSDDGFSAFAGDSVTMYTYHNVMREKFLGII